MLKNTMICWKADFRLLDKKYFTEQTNTLLNYKKFRTEISSITDPPDIWPSSSYPVIEICCK